MMKYAKMAALGYGAYKAAEYVETTTWYAGEMAKVTPGTDGKRKEPVSVLIARGVAGGLVIYLGRDWIKGGEAAK